MKARCEPGDRCVIVAEVPGCEANIGATLTVVALDVNIRLPGGTTVRAWSFKDASRPLVMVDLQGQRTGECTATDEYPPFRCPAYLDHHLVPLHGDGELLLQEKREDVPA